MIEAASAIAFIQSILSTVVGVALGIPAGLYLNRKREERAEAAQEREREELVDRALKLVELAIQHNQRVVEHLLKQMESGAVLLDTTLNTTTWEAVRPDLARLKDPKLKNQIAKYFGDLAQLSWLQRHLVTVTHANIGPTALRDSAEVRESIVRGVRLRADAIRKQGEEILRSPRVRAL